MVNPGNFDINKQCPQVYIYIFSTLIAILLAAKYGTPKQVIMSILSGIITTILLMGINYCDWTFQWLTWFVAALTILVTVINIIFLLDDEEYKKFKMQQKI